MVNTIRWALVMSHFCYLVDVHLLDHERPVGRDCHAFLFSPQWLMWYLHRVGGLETPVESGRHLKPLLTSSYLYQFLKFGVAA